MQAGELALLGEELGLDMVGAAPAAPYEDTERHIRERRGRGLFADMRFTMARPEVSCHPETLLEGARTVVSAALCYWCDEDETPRHVGAACSSLSLDARAQAWRRFDLGCSALRRRRASHGKYHHENEGRGHPASHRCLRVQNQVHAVFPGEICAIEMPKARTGDMVAH